MTQTEQIVWHKLSEEMPSAEGLYLVQFYAGAVISAMYKDGYFMTDEKHILIDNIRIFAWTERPKGRAR